MNKILEDFIHEMEFLKKYMELQRKSYSHYFKSSSGNEEVRLLPIAKIKQFDFNSYIISIYGAYENFIEQILSEYLKKLCTIVSNFSQLPEEIQRNNLVRTMDIIKKLEYPKYKHLKSNYLIEILHKNMNEDYPYLNIEAFKSHTANFKIGVIESYFSSIGIKNLSKSITNYSPLKEYLENEYTEYKTIKNSIIFSKIDTICDTRNSIAHGVRSVQLLGETILNEHIDFFILFSKSLLNLLDDSFLEILFSLQPVIFNPIHVFQKEIICFNTNGINLNKNHTIIVRRENGEYPKHFNLNILEIRKDNKPVDLIEDLNSIDISIKVNREINKKINFAIINLT